MNIRLSKGEQITLLVTLEQKIRDLEKWNDNLQFEYWKHRQDQLFNIYRKAGGSSSLSEIIARPTETETRRNIRLRQETETAHHD